MGMGMNGGGVDMAAMKRMQQMAQQAVVAQQPRGPQAILSVMPIDQLLATVAASFVGSPRERVKYAMELVLEVAAKLPELQERLKALGQAEETTAASCG